MTSESVDEGAHTIAILKNKRVSICSCGMSNTLPYCDDSHKHLNEEQGTNYRPAKIWSDKDVTLAVHCKTWDKKR